MYKLLLLEDDPSLIDGLQYALTKNGFTLTVALTTRAALQLLKENAYDLLLLDVTLPDGTGFSVCEHVRAQGNPVPILFLTAADEEIHIIRGLDSGGDDYLTKPFKLGELCSRIHALLRRAYLPVSPAAGLLQSGDLTIDPFSSTAKIGGKPLELTPGEYKLLCLLVRNAGHILSRQSILNALWDQHGNFMDDNTLSVYIRRLREKIETEPSQPHRLLTARGFGYQWNEGAK